MVPEPELIVGGLTDVIALKIRGVLANPSVADKEITLASRKTFDKISVSKNFGSLEFFLAGNAFAEAEKLVYLLPFTPESFIENLDRLILRKLRGKQAPSKPAPEKPAAKAKELQNESPADETKVPRIELPFATLTKAIIGWAKDGDIDAKLVKLMAAKALFKGKEAIGAAAVRVADARISIASDGAFLVLDSGSFTCNMRPILSAMPSKQLGILDKNLTRIAY